MSDSNLVNDIIETTLENNPSLVEEYHNDTHGALNDLVGEADTYADGSVPKPVLVVELKEQLNSK